MIGTKFYKEDFDKDAYREAAEWCNTTQVAHMEDKGLWYEVVENTVDPDQELVSELYELQEWLQLHDYIGTKIATGRATREDYAEEIAEMTAKAERIDVIMELLGGNK